MQMTQVPTLRNGFPCSALVIEVDTAQRIAAAHRTGARIRLGYVNLRGVTEYRDCYIEAMRPDLFQFTIKHRDFGFRTVHLERIVSLR